MTQIKENTEIKIEDVLNVKTKKKRGKLWFMLFLLLALATAGAYYYYYFLPQQNGQTAAGKVSYITQVIKRGDISTSVTATGNLQPLNQVDIGTELSGTVDEVYVDINDVVTKGQKLARLNTSKLQDTVTKAEATLASAKASLQQSLAKVSQSKASRQQTVANIKQSNAQVQQAVASSKEALSKLSRLQKLHKSTNGKLPARADLDSARATYEKARASVTAAQASESSVRASQSAANASIAAAQADVTAAKAKIEEAKANLNSTKTDMSKAIIQSPINGVVLAREVEPGQTVASSLSAPTLFTLAEDLSKMKLEVSVDEADVGQVKKGQNALFNVDAWAGRKYPAVITRVNLGADTSTNVVSYTTEMQVENADLTLRPGMTATASITTQEEKDVILVPTTALRFTPPASATENDNGQQGDATGRSERGGARSGGGTSSRGNNNSGASNILSKLMPPRRPRRQKSKTPTQAASMSQEQKVWILKDDKAVPVDVKIGISSGKLTSILSGELKSGMKVITGLNEGE